MRQRGLLSIVTAPGASAVALALRVLVIAQTVGTYVAQDSRYAEVAAEWTMPGEAGYAIEAGEVMRASGRQLTEGMSIVVDIWVFGRLGQAMVHTPLKEIEARRRETTKQLFPALWKSMLASRNGQRVQLEKLKLGTPSWEVVEIEPGAEDPSAPGKDQRSPLLRTRFTFTMSDIGGDEAIVRQLAVNFCHDDQGEHRPELVKGVKRALERGQLEPSEGYEFASKLPTGGDPMEAIVQFNSRAIVSGRSDPCVDSQPSQSDARGILFFPTCPAGSMSCGKVRDLCAPSDPDYLCRCPFGYVDSLRFVKETLSYTGDCNTLQPNYCPVDAGSGVRYVTRDGVTPANGTLDEEVLRDCPTGYESDGSAKCKVKDRGGGMWTPSVACKWVPPKAPPRQFCDEPQSEASTFATGCRGCEAHRHPPPPDEDKCKCAVQCQAADDFKRVGSILAGRKACLEKDYPCPLAGTLEAFDDGNGLKCRVKGGDQVHDFCCDEAWGKNLPPENFTLVDDCEMLGDDRSCLQSALQNGLETPCCWLKQKHLATQHQCFPATGIPLDHEIEACAIEKRVPRAEWQPFPDCSKMCPNTFAKYWMTLDVLNCDTCSPREDPTQKCGCEVACKFSDGWVGGGPPQSKPTCVGDNTHVSFDTEPPVCMEQPPLPKCDALANPTWSVKGCANCVAGQSFEDCPCTVGCAGNHKYVGGSRMDLECGKVRHVGNGTKCEDAADKKDCRSMASDMPIAPLTQEVPCCWREDKFKDGSRCVQRGSPHIQVGFEPEVCAPSWLAAWNETSLPECVPECPNPFEAKLIVLGAWCDHCTASPKDHDLCNCTLKCPPPSVRIGGGKEDLRECKVLEQGGTTPTFGAPPVCFSPHALPQERNPNSEDKFMSGLVEVRKQCSQLVSDPEKGWKVSNCPRKCYAGEDRHSCSCKVDCLQTHRKVSGGDQGEKACRMVHAERNDTRCSLQTLKHDCLNSMESGKPCCWHDEGLSGRILEDGVQKCEIVGSENIERVPQQCGELYEAHWEEMPTCEKKCENSFTRWLDSMENENCDNCVPSRPCACKVWCKDTHIQVGGPQYRERPCLKDFTFEGPPICVPNGKIIPDAESQPGFSHHACPKPVVSSVRSIPLGCEQCKAEEPPDRCLCFLWCSETHQAVPKESEGQMVCSTRNRTLIDLQASGLQCHQTDSKEACLNSTEGTKRCCYKPDGLSATGATCLAQGSPDINAVPEACADGEEAYWEFLPNCVRKCAPPKPAPGLYISPECKDCLEGQNALECKCYVGCYPGWVQYGGGQPGFRSCTSEQNEMEEPPRCMREEAPPKCRLPVGFSTTMEVVSTCTACNVNDENCLTRCKVTCQDTYAADRPVPANADCYKVPNTEVKNTSCAGLGKDKCLLSRDADTEQPCCWHGGDTCSPRGSRGILEQPECAREFAIEWRGMPDCDKQCDSRMPPRPPKWVTYDPEKCYACTMHRDGCDCDVRCANGYERVGGGPEGHRNCFKGNRWHSMPACIKKVSAKCPPLDRSIYDARQCGDCSADEHDSCNCRVMGCQDGYRLPNTSGVAFPVSPACVGSYAHLREVGEADGGCDGAVARRHMRGKDPRLGQCTSLAERHGDTLQPCCFRWQGYHDYSRVRSSAPRSVCQRRFSDLIRWREEPRLCAPKNAIWQGEPDCKPKCTNLFASSIFNDNDCDDCIVGESCPCTVECGLGLTEFPVRRLSGSRQCISGHDGRPTFGNIPRCLKKCLPPDDQQGRLKISGCDECFAGEDGCDCKVSCWNREYLAWPGPVEGDKTCNIDGTFKNLPSCVPKCFKPKDPVNTIDLRNCPNQCNALFPTSRDCECEVKCYGDHQPASAGTKVCEFVPGVDGAEASGRWVDPVTRSPAMPSCLAPFTMKVVDGVTGLPVEGAIIRTFLSLVDYQDGRTPLTSNETEASGEVESKTEELLLFIVVSKDQYDETGEYFNRIERCETTPEDCLVILSISKKLGGGDIHHDGCYFEVDSRESASWEMRATLTWPKRPKDFDIWAVNTECADNAINRYNCLDWTPNQAETTGRCRRWWFASWSEWRSERGACEMHEVEEKELTTESFYTVYNADGTPKTVTMAQNNFPKWVTWANRYCSKMHMKKTSGRTVTRERWNPDNYMVLDVDKRDGSGPETITFHNVPPGTYKVGAHYFGGKSGNSIKQPGTRIRLTLGGNGVQFECAISPRCKDVSRFWSVVDIQITDAGTSESGKRKFRIRLHDEQRRMKNIAAVGVPTMHKLEGFDYWPSQATPQVYSDQYLRAACHGMCEPAPNSTAWRGCLSRHDH